MSQALFLSGEKYKRPTVDCGGPRKSMTKQAHKEECDINSIMRKFQKTGALTHFAKHEGAYGFATSVDFTTACQIVAQGKSMFEELPSEIRGRFENDPAKFLEFVQNPENQEEMRELGLVASDSEPVESPSERALSEPPGESAGVPEDAPPPAEPAAQ